MKRLTKRQESLLYQTLVLHYIQNSNFKVDPYEIFSDLEIEYDQVSSETMHEIESFIHLYSSRMIRSAENVKRNCLTPEAVLESYMNTEMLPNNPYLS